MPKLQLFFTTHGRKTSNLHLQRVAKPKTGIFMMSIRLTPHNKAKHTRSIVSKTRHAQCGAAALEYLVLAAAIIAIVTVLATNDTVKTALETAFEGLFTSATESASSET